MHHEQRAVMQCDVRYSHHVQCEAVHAVQVAPSVHTCATDADQGVIFPPKPAKGHGIDWRLE